MHVHRANVLGKLQCHSTIDLAVSYTHLDVYKRKVLTFGISHHTDDTGSDAWKEDGLVARMSRICKQTVPEMIVMLREV